METTAHPDGGQSPEGQEGPGRVVAGLDGSELSVRAATTAASLAEALGADLGLCHVEVDDQRAPTDLTEVTKWITGEITRVRAESPAAGILAFAGDDPDDLIVVATHGVGGRAASLLGSVAFELLCTAPQPLVLVPPDFERYVDELGTWRPTTVVALVDGTADSELVLPLAAALARSAGWSMELTIVVPDEPPPLHPPPDEALRGHEDRYLDEVIQRHGIADLSPIPRIHPDPIGVASAVRSMTRRQGRPDAGGVLVAMAGHRRSGVPLLLEGSNAARVAGEAFAPVLVQPIPPMIGREQPLADAKFGPRTRRNL
jgi:nucleotide-binding universal stress UspA family protein